MLEIFFDLFFAASYTVFSKNQSVTSSSRIAGYIGYFTSVLPANDDLFSFVFADRLIGCCGLLGSPWRFTTFAL